jgi:hypothetical protein
MERFGLGEVMGKVGLELETLLIVHRQEPFLGAAQIGVVLMQELATLSQ